MPQWTPKTNPGVTVHGGGSRPASPSKPPGVTAKYPQYGTYINRLRSFTLGAGWPKQKAQKPNDFAKAGLYFAGEADCTRCFSCGGGLRNWMPGDQPDVEHARFYPHCDYIKSLKGEEFVANVDRDFPREYFDTSDDLQEDRPRSTEPAHIDYDQMVRGVLMKPCCEALSRLGFPSKLVKDAVTRVLSENEWNESWVTCELLANACFDLQESESNNASKVADIDVPDKPTDPNPSSERRLSIERAEERSRDEVNAPPSPTEDEVESIAIDHSVRCFHCGGGLDDVTCVEHNRRFPHCSAESHHSGQQNRDTASPENHVNPLVPECEETAETGEVENQGTSDTEDTVETFMESFDILAAYPSQVQYLGIVTDHAKYGDFTSPDQRMASFTNWNSSHEQTPSQLTAAGFFYTGNADLVNCFCCGGGLRDWEPDDYPWVEHARWFPQCSYVRLFQGREFTDECSSEIGKLSPPSPITDPGTAFVNPGQRSGNYSEELEQAVDEDLRSVLPLLEGELSKQQIRSALKICFIKQGNFRSVDCNRLRQTLLEMTEEQINRRIDLYMENHMLVQQLQCKVCFKYQVSIVFLPCGHLAVCPQCAYVVDTCPICQCNVRARVKTLLT